MYRREGDSRKVQLQSVEVHFWETSSNLGSKKHKVQRVNDVYCSQKRRVLNESLFLAQPFLQH